MNDGGKVAVCTSVLNFHIFNVSTSLKNKNFGKVVVDRVGKECSFRPG